MPEFNFSTQTALPPYPYQPLFNAKSISMTINILRSILILLVIQIHVSPFTDRYPDLQHAILGFIIPIFLFLTGFLFNVRKTMGQYLQYLVKFIVPYVLLETAFVCLSAFLPVRDGIQELTLRNVLHHVLLAPLGPYWYLHTMIICGTIYFLSEKLCNYYSKGFTFSLTILISICLSYFTDIIGTPATLAYFAGVAARRMNWNIEDSFTPSFFAIPILIATICYGVWADTAFASQTSIYCILAGATFISGIRWTTEKLTEKTKEILAFIGANTLPIYLLHPIFTMLSKKLFSSLLIKDETTCLFSLITLALSVAGSLTLIALSDKLHLTFLLGQKKMLRKQVTIISNHNNININTLNHLQ